MITLFFCTKLNVKTKSATFYPGKQSLEIKNCFQEMRTTTAFTFT